MQVTDTYISNEPKQAEEEGTEADSDATPDTSAPPQSQTTKPPMCEVPSTRPDHEAA